MGQFELPTLAGAPYRWNPGRTTVLSFCAFWCDTWKDQLPRVRESMRITRGLPVDYATISVDGRWTERARSAAAGTMLGDPGGVWCHVTGIDRVPYTLVVAPSGRVIWTAYGTVRTTDLVNAVRASVADRNAPGGRIYLTFGDFPTERLSDELLDALRAEGVRATLFCAGAGASGELRRRAMREGHVLADASAARGLPTDDPYDATRPGVKELVRRVLMGARPNAVVRLHAGVEETLRALPTIVRNLRERGFTFETLEAKPE